MYAITGITGHVGGATARAPSSAAAAVRAIVRDPAKGDASSRPTTVPYREGDPA